MEFLLLWIDELDDFLGTLRHVAQSAQKIVEFVDPEQQEFHCIHTFSFPRANVRGASVVRCEPPHRQRAVAAERTCGLSARFRTAPIVTRLTTCAAQRGYVR